MRKNALMGRSLPDRIAAAEAWRVAGDSLRKRSPARFAKLLDMVAAFAVTEPDEGTEDIDEVYQVH